MADYENLLDSIDAVIKSNNRREITGQILQNTLHQMVGSLGENYQLAGFATPTLDPNSPDQNVFYITDEAGVYTNFDNITLGAGLSFLMWKNEEWTSKTLDIVTADWLDEHYVSKAFLRKVFQFFDEDGVEIFPNDTESVVDNIKAMCGLWTNEYLSALGLGEGSTIPTTLAALNDVTITNPQDGQALVYDAASLHWVNATIQSGVDMSVVWAALAGATNEQINISHLTTALNDYVTATSLATTLQSYVTTSALATELANYASQSWVETNYVSKAFFNSLFQAQDVNGNAITPNNSGQTTIDRLKILVGAYTEQYLSALGLSSGGGGGGSSTLAGLNDVTITNPQDGQALIYDAQSSHWVNGAAISMSAVWTALAAATSEQINSSHLTSALSGYVTTSALASELANYVTTSGLATTLADYVTTSALTTTLAEYGSKTWIDNNYVSKAFFNRLFQAFAPLAEGQTEPTQVEPNDTTTTIDNIKAMFGLWTEQYLSALGLSAGGGHTIGVLNDLNDVTITNPQNDQVLKYNNGIWVNAAAPSGASALSGLTDVAISTLADKDLLQWDYASGKWKNVVLSTAMSAYALASSIPTNVSQLNNDSGFITGITSSMVTAALGYTPANSTELSNYLPLSGGTLTTSYQKTTINNSGIHIYTSSNTKIAAIGSGTSTPTSGSELGILQLFNNGTEIHRLYALSNSHSWLCYATGSNLGIGTDTPSYKLHVNGTAYATSFVKANGTSNQFLKADGSVDSNSYITSAGNCTYATNSTFLYASDSPYRYGDSAPYYAYITYNTNSDNRWYLRMSPATPANISVDYAYNAGNADTVDGYHHSSFVKTSGNGTITTSYGIYTFGNGGLLITDAENYKIAYIGSGSSTPTSVGTYGIVRLYNYNEENIRFYTLDNSWILNNNFGLGTSSPLYKLHVIGDIALGAAGSSGKIGTPYASDNSNMYNYITIKGRDSVAGDIVYTAGTWTSGTHDAHIFVAGNRTNALVIRNHGNVGINVNLPSYALHVVGDIYATGGVTALSDIRHKTIVEDTRLQVSDIARMRAVRYLWNDGRKDNSMHVGSIAQDWQQILPEVVLRANNDEGTLSLQYGVAALISSITIARKVVNHEERITELERENVDLKRAYSFIKNAYDYLKMDYENLKLKIA